MRCPNCDSQQPEGASECARCGLIFARWRPRSAVKPPAGRDWRALLLGSQVGIWPLRLGLLLLLVGLSLKYLLGGLAATAEGFSFLHMVNLPFHEAGHVLFSPFPRLITSLGGSLGQLGMPLICAAVLLIKTRDAFGASVALWWHGQNFVDIAPYIADARAGELMLLGGNTAQTSPYGFHDWQFILGETGLLAYDQVLAWTAHFWGLTVMLVALGWGGWVVWSQQRVQ